MKLNLIYACGLSMLLVGCAGVNLQDNLVHLPVQPSAKSSGSGYSYSAEIGARHPRLEMAYAQIKHADPEMVYSSIKANSSPKMGFAKNFAEDTDVKLPSILVNDPTVSKIVVASREALVNGKPNSVKISKGDLEQTARMLQENFGLGAVNNASGTAKPSTALAFNTDSKTATFKIIHDYLSAYFLEKDGFIDREGTKFTAPDFTGSVADSEISAIMSVFMEGVYDGLLDTPVWVDGNAKVITKSGSTPTALTLKYAVTQRVSDNDTITPNDLKFINFTADLAGVQSKAVSGMVFRAIGKINIGFAIEGGFSFGDNQTLAQILDAIFQTSAKRLTVEGLVAVYKSQAGDKAKTAEVSHSLYFQR